MNVRDVCVFGGQACIEMVRGRFGGDVVVSYVGVLTMCL